MVVVCECECVCGGFFEVLSWPMQRFETEFTLTVSQGSPKLTKLYGRRLATAGTVTLLTHPLLSY